MNATIRFRFRHVDAEGRQTGFLRSKGHFDGKTLMLQRQGFAIDDILRAERRSDRLLLTVRNTKSVSRMTIVCGRRKARDLAQVISRAATRVRAALHRDQLQKLGREDEFIILECPYCECLVDLSGFGESPQAWCSACDSLFSRDGTGPKDEGRYHHCESCGFFAQPQDFTEFYFYFLFVIYGGSCSTRHFCHTCMRSTAWTMMAVNLLFLVGVPISVWQLGRAYFAGSNRSATFKGLDKANALARNGRTDDAVRVYEAILERHSLCAGVYYNLAIANLRADRFDDACAAADNALLVAANYVPARDFLAACFQATGRAADMHALLDQWPRSALHESNVDRVNESTMSADEMPL